MGNYFFLIYFFSSDHLVSSSMKSCYFSIVHLIICLIVCLNLLKQKKWVQQELTDFHLCPEKHMNLQRVQKLSILLVASFHIRGKLCIRLALGAFCVCLFVFFSLTGLNISHFVTILQQCSCVEPFVGLSWFD